MQPAAYQLDKTCLVANEWCLSGKIDFGNTNGKCVLWNPTARKNGLSPYIAPGARIFSILWHDLQFEHLLIVSLSGTASQLCSFVSQLKSLLSTMKIRKRPGNWIIVSRSCTGMEFFTDSKWNVAVHFEVLRQRRKTSSNFPEVTLKIVNVGGIRSSAS